MWPNAQFPANLVTLTKEIANWKLQFLCRVQKCCKGARTLLNLSGLLFCKCDSMHSMGINFLVGRCTVRPVLESFNEASLTSLPDLLLIRSISMSIRHRCLGALLSCINTTSLTLIYGELLLNGLNVVTSTSVDSSHLHYANDARNDW